VVGCDAWTWQDAFFKLQVGMERQIDVEELVHILKTEHVGVQLLEA
jgi:hypothetical protein